MVKISSVFFVIGCLQIFVALLNLPLGFMSSTQTFGLVLCSFLTMFVGLIFLWIELRMA